jgi:outer membrane protein assembly factor BamB
MSQPQVQPLRLCTLFTVTALLIAASGVHAENWPRYRGPHGDGHTAATNLPVKWDATNTVWRTALPGRGQSSPVTWGDRVYLTSADLDGAKRIVLCLDASDGAILWQTVIETSRAAVQHRMNSFASPSCATDGEIVAAFFGEAGLHGFDASGKKLWSRDLGQFPGDWGTAASPIMHGDVVIQNCDAEGESYLIAVNKRTGRTVWQTPRRETPKGGWSTPVLIEAALDQGGTRSELILNGEFGVHGYDPATGKELWFCKGFNGRGSPMPVFGHGLLIVLNGKPGDLYAVRPGGEGDVTATRMAWHAPRGGDRDLPSPILAGDFVFTVSMNGVARGNDAKTGRELFEERLRDAFSAAPIAANGLIYLLSERGVTRLIKPGASLNIVAENDLGKSGVEIFRAAPVPHKGRLLIRSDTALYCVGDGRAAE